MTNTETKTSAQATSTEPPNATVREDLQDILDRARDAIQQIEVGVDELNSLMVEFILAADLPKREEVEGLLTISVPRPTNCSIPSTHTLKSCAEGSPPSPPKTTRTTAKRSRSSRRRSKAKGGPTMIAPTWLYDDGGRAAAGFPRRGRRLRDTCDRNRHQASLPTSLRRTAFAHCGVRRRPQPRRQAGRPWWRTSRDDAAQWRLSGCLTTGGLSRRLGWTWTPTMAIGQGCKVHLRADELPERSPDREREPPPCRRHRWRHPRYPRLQLATVHVAYTVISSSLE